MFDEEEQKEDKTIDGIGDDADLKIKEVAKQAKKPSIKNEPNFSSIEMNNQGTLTIETTNIKTVHVKYYIINAEILFSRAPFMKDNTEQFSYVKPYF